MSIEYKSNIENRQGSMENVSRKDDLLGPDSSDQKIQIQLPLGSGFDTHFNQKINPPITQAISNNNDDAIRMYGNHNLQLNASRKISTESKEPLLSQRSRWKDLSSLERSLSVALGLVSLLAIALMIAVIIVGVKLNKDEYKSPLKTNESTIYPPWVTTIKTTPGITGEPEVTTRERPTSTPSTSVSTDSWMTCWSDECVLVAEEIEFFMDPLINPCDDFYQFACGGWIKNNPIPTQKSSLNQFDKIQDILNIEIRNILESNATEDDSEPISIARQFYESCLNIDYEQDLVNDSIRQLIEEMLFELNNETVINSTLSIITVLAKIRRELNGNYIFSLQIDTDLEDHDKNAIYLEKPDFEIVYKHHLENQTYANLSAYKIHIVDLWTNIFPEDIDIAETIADNIIDFEITLIELSSEKEGTKYLTQPYEVDYEESLVGSGDLEFPEKEAWKYFTSLVIGNISDSCSTGEFFHCSAEIIPNVIIMDIEYFTSIDSVLSEMNLTTIENYLKWKIILDYASDTNKTILDELYNESLVGLNSSSPRLQKCIEETNSFFGPAISALIIQESVEDPHLLKEKLNDMAETLKEVLYEMTQEFSWISNNETRDVILERLESLNIFSAYPLSLLDKNMSAVLDFYSDLNLTDISSYFQNILDLVRWKSKNEFKTLLSNSEETMLIEAFQIQSTIKIIYKSLTNTIYLPLGLLQSPFYRDLKNNSTYLNYGSLGTLIGLRLIEALENTAVSYENGSLKGIWDRETIQNFKDATDCLKTQYSGYEISEMGNNFSINGENTVRMNTLDLGGFKLALRAYTSHKSRFDGFEDQKLPGLEKYSSDQLFFVGFAQTRCSAYTTEQLLQEISIGDVTPASYRVNGVLENSEEFKRAWMCQVQNNTTEICQIW